MKTLAFDFRLTPADPYHTQCNLIRQGYRWMGMNHDWFGWPQVHNKDKRFLIAQENGFFAWIPDTPEGEQFFYKHYSHVLSQNTVR